MKDNLVWIEETGGEQINGALWWSMTCSILSMVVQWDLAANRSAKDEPRKVGSVQTSTVYHRNSHKVETIKEEA